MNNTLLSRLLIVSLIVTLNIMASGLAMANDPCILDEANLCGTIRPGKGRVLDCMASKSPQLSPDCRAYITELYGQVREVREACAADIQRYCANVPAEPLARISCLRSWTDQIMPSCSNSYNKLKSMPYQPDY